MPLNINTSNYINTSPSTTGNSQGVSGSVSYGSDGVEVSVKGLDLKAGQTLSGQVVEIDGKDIKLLLSNNQTINAKLEGNINALLGQTLSFEVKSSDNGQTALRPLYTNLNNSPAVANALTSAGLPHTDGYAKMVSSMMDEGMPINKNALYDMSRQVNSFPTSNPETIVKLNKLGLQINELTINQYENYKGLERQIVGDVDTISKGLTDLMNDSLNETVKSLTSESTMANQGILSGGKNLLSAFLSALSGTDAATTANDEQLMTNISGESNGESTKIIDPSVFDTSKTILDLVETSNEQVETNFNNIENQAMQDALLSGRESVLADILGNNSNDSTINNQTENVATIPNEIVGEKVSENLKNLSIALNDSITADNINVKQELAAKFATSENGLSDTDVISFAKEVLNNIAKAPEKFSEATKEKLAKLLSDKEFSTITKDALSKQILLKPEDAVNSKNIDDLYNKIIKQANQAVEILNNAGRDNPEVMNAAKNITDNVNFMHELNQVATYVQLPLLMNNKSAHGDLYVYTNKKSLKNNDGNVSALLHLDMENLGPMDVYVALKDGKNLNTHFYLQDDATIDFIAEHIDFLNKRLTEKGYNTDMNISIKDKGKGKTNMADEFLKDEPGKEGVIASKFSFDVRA